MLKILRLLCIIMVFCMSPFKSMPRVKHIFKISFTKLSSLCSTRRCAVINSNTTAAEYDFTHLSDLIFNLDMREVFFVLSHNSHRIFTLLRYLVSVHSILTKTLLQHFQYSVERILTERSSCQQIVFFFHENWRTYFLSERKMLPETH